MNKIFGKQYMNNQKGFLSAESPGDGEAVRGKELKDRNMLTLTQKAEVLCQYFCFMLGSLVCSSARNRYFPCYYTLRV